MRTVKRWRRPANILRASAVASLIVFASSVPAGATVLPKTNCTTPSGNYLEGADLPADTRVFGVHARIEVLDPELCGPTSTDSFSSAWVMVYADSQAFPGRSENQAWAQAGYIQAGTSVILDGQPADAKIRAFAQYTLECKSTVLNGCSNGKQVKTKIGQEVAIDSSPYFSVYSARGSTVKMYLWGGGVLLDTISSYDPYGVWDNKWRAQWIGETSHTDTDIPGTPVDKVNFDTLEYRDVNDAWQDPWVAPRHSNNPYQVNYREEAFTPEAGRGQYGIKIWTDPYHG